MNWTEAEVETLRTMFAEGASDVAIGAMLGRSPGSVRHARSGREPGLSRPQRRGPDDTERAEQIAAMWADGLSGGQIATRLGLTRNAVIGMVRRLELPKRRTAVKWCRTNVRPPRAKQPPYKTYENFARDIAPTLADPSPDDVIGILQLTERTCRWPIGDPQDAGFGFCGRDAVLGKPYCSGHAVVAFEPPKKRARTDFTIRTNRILEAAE